MDSSTLAKIFGIVVLVVMALSMLGALLYTNNAPQSTEPLPVAQQKQFDYSLSFDANVVKELGSLRVAAYTTQSDKAKIDSEVQKVEGVSALTSQFKKAATDANEWTYIADVTLKKGYASADIAPRILSISQLLPQGAISMKYMTISVPVKVHLVNSSLGLDRNFSFPVRTVSSLTSLGTLPDDVITVSGNITMQGDSIVGLELLETENKKLALRELGTSVLPQFDTNSDANAPAQTPNPDLNSQTDSNN